MSKNKEYELAIKIAGEVEKSFYESTKLTQKELKNIAKQAAMTATAAETSYGSIGSKISKGLKDAEPAFSGLERAAQASFKSLVFMAGTAGAGISAGLIGSIHVGSEFESAFAGVKKTVNASSEELAQMRDDIRQMAREEIPATAAELSEIAESGGQLGIHNENIIEFTATMANMDVATNLSSEDAATEFAQFANIVDMSQDHFDNLGSTVVALGNNMATTEADIMAMGMRIAAAGDQVQLSEADIMAYSAALSSVGIEAEAGGTAFSKLLTKLQMAVETGEGLKNYAKVAGMTGTEFKKAFEEDATTAINAFLSGLNDTERNGMSAIAVLDEMGLTEVRLRDTLLRASNASEMFEDALEMSSEAWEENNALTKEAEQRYKTMESQTAMTGNKITDLGISVYDDLRPGLTEGIGLVNEFIDSMAGQEDVIGDMIDSATKKMPTMVREAKNAGDAISDFAEPFLAVGGWLADNPGVITGSIAGIGTALATYKVASGVSALVGALGSLNPVGMAIMGLGGVAAVITGIGTSVKKAANDAKKANLDAHFGNIALSLSDLQETAAHIIQSRDLDAVRESVLAMDEAEGIADSIKDTTDALNKMNWKISMGMELGEAEKDEYRNQIESYISSTQEYLTQKQYAVNIAVGVLTDDDLEGKDIVSKVNQFYAAKQNELQKLGTDLNNAITEAFNDGLLEIDEVEKITKLQAQMAEIQNALAGAEYDANLELMKSKYLAGDLDADSFINLQAELKEQTAAASEEYEKSFVMAATNAKVMLQDGAIDQTEYDRMVAEFQENYLEQMGELQSKASSFQTQAIMEQYGDEINGIDLNEKIRERLDSALGNIAAGNNAVGSWDADSIYKLMDLDMDKSTKAALSELWEEMQPQFEQQQRTIEQYREAGMAIPESIEEGMLDSAAIGALVGDQNAIYAMMGAEARNNPEYMAMMEDLREQGAYIPEQIAAGITGNVAAVQNAMTGVYGSMAESFSSIKAIGQSVVRTGQEPVKTGHADGGIFTVPHVAWFAEEGPEAAIPLDGSAHAIDLWEKTGELLGMDGLSGGVEPLTASIEEAAYAGAGETMIHIDNSREINFYGDSPSKDEVEEILEDEDEQFARMMQRYLGNNRRVSFS
ncbi:MAG: phage tail tape measure protein [Lachnospiraceae bacterium]|nr:phage tail tape measure protein [Lachnospiraceae bacterium]